MVNSGINFDEMLANLNSMKKELTKSADVFVKNFSDTVKQGEVKKEKRGKFNKKPCNMQLLINGNVNIIFDDPNEAIKIFE